MDWDNCIESSVAIKVSSNRERSLSLLKSAKNTASFVMGMEINENNASILLKNYYEALLELMHSLLYRRGYKVLDHVCVGYFIRDVLKDQDAFRTFDKYRKIRNSIVYYGESVEKEVAENGIKEMGAVFDKMEKLAHDNNGD